MKRKLNELQGFSYNIRRINKKRNNLILTKYIIESTSDTETARVLTLEERDKIIKEISEDWDVDNPVDCYVYREKETDKIDQKQTIQSQKTQINVADSCMNKLINNFSIL